jgi:hypothetical protein
MGLHGLDLNELALVLTSDQKILYRVHSTKVSKVYSHMHCPLVGAEYGPDTNQ